jgi:hypothetical protein
MTTTPQTFTLDGQAPARRPAPLPPLTGKQSVLFDQWQKFGYLGLFSAETPEIDAPRCPRTDDPGPVDTKTPPASDLHRGPDCTAFDDGTCRPWCGRCTSLAPMPDERPCPLTKTGKTCYHFRRRDDR